MSLSGMDTARNKALAPNTQSADATGAARKRMTSVQQKLLSKDSYPAQADSDQAVQQTPDETPHRFSGSDISHRQF